MNINEMIKVMQHYADGGDIQFSNDNFETVFVETKKEVDGDLCWNWYEFEYRIKESKQKVTIEKWLFRDKQGDFLVIEISNADNYKQYEKVKLIESYEVEL